MGDVLAGRYGVMYTSTSSEPPFPPARVGKDTPISALRHLISTRQVDRPWLEEDLFPLVEQLRSDGAPSTALAGRSLYCLFYEPSFLTRTSFERAIDLLGGSAHHTEDASQFFPVKSPNFIDNIMNMLASLHIDIVVLRSSDPQIVERAAEADALPIINGGSSDDHPTQAMTDISTIGLELGGVDGVTVAVVGRPDHRNVSALLRGLALFRGVKVLVVPFSGQADPDVVLYCQERGVQIEEAGIDAVREADVVYLNGPRTLAHVQFLQARGAFNLRIDSDFMALLKPHCIILDPMQRSGDFPIEVQDHRLAYYRQAENSLYVRMALLTKMLGLPS